MSLMTLLKLFLTFAKIGAFSVGGGYAMLPIIQEEVVDVNHWLTIEEYMDAIAVAGSLPGAIAINTATYVGHKVAGIPGSLSATAGVVAPSLIMVLLVATVLFPYRNSHYVESLFNGFRPAVVGLIAAAAYSMGQKGVVDWKSALLMLAVFFAVGFANFNPILAIIISGMIGLLFF